MKRIATATLIILMACNSAGIDNDSTSEPQRVPCEEMPGQVTAFNAEGVSQGVSIVLAARLGPSLPQLVLGCFVQPTSYGTALCADVERETSCHTVTDSVPRSSCEVARDIYYIGEEFFAVCGRLTDVDGNDDNIVIDVAYTHVLTTP